MKNIWLFCGASGHTQTQAHLLLTHLGKILGCSTILCPASDFLGQPMAQFLEKIDGSVVIFFDPSDSSEKLAERCKLLTEWKPDSMVFYVDSGNGWRDKITGRGVHCLAVENVYSLSKQISKIIFNQGEALALPLEGSFNNWSKIIH